MKLSTVIVLPSQITLGLASSVLLDNGSIITFDDSSQSVQILRNTSILVQDDRITAIFPAGSYNDTLPADTEIISATGKIVSPGFIDTHRHLWQSAYRTIAQNITLSSYTSTLAPGLPAVVERFKPDDVYYGQYFGILEGLNAGVTSIVDHSHGTWNEENAEASLKASIDTDARIFWGFNFQGNNPDYPITRQTEAYQRLLASTDWDATPVEFGVSYDQFTESNRSSIDEVVRVVREYNVSVLSTHYLGGPWIAPNSPAVLNDLGLLNGTTPVLFVHSTHITPDEVQLLREHNHYVAIAPESEMHFGHDYPHAHKLLDQAALAVDAAWTFSGDIVTQARIWLQSVRRHLFAEALHEWKVPSNNAISVNQAFILATKNGAQALRRPDLGILQIGAKADIVVFDGSAVNVLGWNDPVAAVILHSHPGNVEHVLVDGRFRKRNFELVISTNTSRDLSDARERFLESAQRIQTLFLQDRPVHLEGDYRPGVPFAELDHSDVLRGDATGY